MCMFQRSAIQRLCVPGNAEQALQFGIPKNSSTTRRRAVRTWNADESVHVRCQTTRSQGQTGSIEQSLERHWIRGGTAVCAGHASPSIASS